MKQLIALLLLTATAYAEHSDRSARDYQREHREIIQGNMDRFNAEIAANMRRQQDPDTSFNQAIQSEYLLDKISRTNRYDDSTSNVFHFDNR